MTEAKQTKCPHCGSTFRISETQLAAKGGNVRCGSCLQVFRADLHLVGAAAPVAAAKPQPAAAPKPKAKTAPDDESWALELLGEEAPQKARAESRFEVEETIPPRRIAKEQPEDDWKPSATKMRFDTEIDDHGFIAESPTGSPSRSLRFDDELSDLLDDAGDGLAPHEEEQAHIISATADESWAQSILSELEQQEHKEKKKQYGMEIIRDDKPAKAPPKNLKMAAAMGQKVDPEALAAARASEAPAARQPAPKPAAPAKPKDDVLSFDEDDDALNFLNEDLDLNPGRNQGNNAFSLAQPLAHVDAPVVLTPARRPIDWARLLTWGFLCLIAIALFATQYIYFNFDKLAADARLRPQIEEACAKLGCYVPDIPDASKLKVEDLVIRAHPKVAGAIQIDALVKNTATFAQPFPALKLTFTDRNDQLVAARIFQPAEYLQGEGTRLRRIPPDTPVRISLSLVNPGTEAVNYSMEPLL